MRDLRCKYDNAMLGRYNEQRLTPINNISEADFDVRCKKCKENYFLKVIDKTLESISDDHMEQVATILIKAPKNNKQKKVNRKTKTKKTQNIESIESLKYIMEHPQDIILPRYK